MVLSPTVIREKNSLARNSAFRHCLEITIPGSTETVRITDNNEELTWRDVPWKDIPFKVSQFNTDAKGELPRVEILISNINGEMEGYTSAYVDYCKANGFKKVTATVYLVNTKDLANPVAVTEHDLILKRPKHNSQWASYTMGATNTMARGVPASIMLRDRCRYRRYRGVRCQYAGDFPGDDCGRTYHDCCLRGNQDLYGGGLGVGSGGVYVG